MSLGLKQFVPHEICLSCDGCCRFKEELSVWRPRVARQELQSKSEGGLADIILNQDSVEEAGQIKTKPCSNEGYQCAFFNLTSNTCEVYSSRPLDCQLYPFVLTKNRGNIFLSVHLPCPFIEQKKSSPEFAEYVNYLQGFFKRPEVQHLLENNPHLVGDYDDYREELEALFPIKIQT